MGSPPQVRGKLSVNCNQTFNRRITPAGAGKTTRAVRRAIVKWDHPRRCGENHRTTSFLRQRMGSPPQVRGKLCRKMAATNRAGITPAGAGKTVAHLLYQIRRKDHPRRCGENEISVSYQVHQKGSPPQVRGKLVSVAYAVCVPRITPAGAGKTVGLLLTLTIKKDHPRRCGENEGVYLFAPPKRGSPPQVRGKPVSECASIMDSRITPAGTGKTPACIQYCRSHEDHPRRCGENQHVRMHDRQGQGSPPQVRGKLCCFTSPTKGSGITPAGAGKTRKRGLRRCCAQDHPRRCGENRIDSTRRARR